MKLIGAFAVCKGFAMCRGHMTSNETYSYTEEDTQNDLLSLKKYLKDANYSKKKIQKITDKFKKVSKKDSRIVMLGKKHYINPAKFDYSDLLN